MNVAINELSVFTANPIGKTKKMSRKMSKSGPKRVSSLTGLMLIHHPAIKIEKVTGGMSRCNNLAPAAFFFRQMR